MSRGAGRGNVTIDGTTQTQVVDSAGAVVDQFGVDDAYLAGVGTVGSITMTTASTAYAVPLTAIDAKHTLMVYNVSATDAYMGFSTLTSGGVQLPAGGVMTLDLGANQGIFAYCSNAGAILNYTTKKVS
jgi:hypothetical protein